MRTWQIALIVVALVVVAPAHMAAKIAAGTITATEIASDAIMANKIAAIGTPAVKERDGRALTRQHGEALKWHFRLIS